VPLHGVGHGGEANRAGDGSAPFLPSDPGKFYRTNFKYLEAKPGPPSRIAHVGPQVPPAPLRFAARSGRSATGRAPPMGSHGGNLVKRLVQGSGGMLNSSFALINPRSEPSC